MRYWEPPESGVGGPGIPKGGYPPEKKEDKDITEAVRVALFLDPEINEAQFDISTEDGVVRLSGIAKSQNERRRVRDLALGVEGVREVVDHLRIMNE